MPKSINQKLKLIFLMKILLEQTDEEHPITLAEIIAELDKEGISAARNALYNDIELLRSCDIDIETTKSKTVGYYIANRDFELPELRLLVDAVQSSHFLTHGKSKALIAKITKLANVHQAKKLREQVFVKNRLKPTNEKIFYAVDTIHNAISEKRKISFKYYEYGLNKRLRLRRGGHVYIVSPYAMIWEDDFYYLISHNDEHDGLTHFRIDKMTDVTMLEEASKASIKKLDVSEYTKHVFGMFSGELSEVELIVENNLIGVVIDKFGNSIPITPTDDNHFRTVAKVAISHIFFGWVFSFNGRIKITGPESIIEEYRKMALQATL